MVQAKILFPKPKLVIFVVGESEFVIVPLPETNVQTPVPIAGEFAAITALALEIQMVWLGPATAAVGIGLT